MKQVEDTKKAVPGVAQSSRRHFYASVYLLIVGFYLVTASGGVGLSDSVAMLNVAESMARHASINSDPCEFDASDPTGGASVGCVPGSDGRHYAGYGLVPSLLVVPTVLLSRLVAGILHVNSLALAKAGVSIFTLLIAPLVCLVLAAWVLKLGYSRGIAVIAACVLAFASPYWHFSSKGFLSEPYFTLALLVAACLLSYPRRRFACSLAGLAFGVACGTRLNGVILLPAFVAGMALYVRAHKLARAELLRDLMRFSMPFSLCVLLIAWANYARFGSPLKTGYHLAFPTAAAMLSTPFLHGLLNLLFSGDYGLLTFTPWVFLSWVCSTRFIRSHQPESALCGISFLIYVVFFAKFSNASAGWVSGPRFLTPLLPFLVIGMVPAIDCLWQKAARKRKRTFMDVAVKLLLVLLPIGLLIQLLGTIYPDERYFVLTAFYEHRTDKPLWTGSVPLASIDFLTRMHMANDPASGERIIDPSSLRHRTEAAFASADLASTEEQFLNSLPNPGNLALPNLLWLKFRMIGLPASLGVVYLAIGLAIGIAGAVGFRQILRTGAGNSAICQAHAAENSVPS